MTRDIPKMADFYDVLKVNGSFLKSKKEVIDTMIFISFDSG